MWAAARAVDSVASRVDPLGVGTAGSKAEKKDVELVGPLEYSWDG